MPNYTKASFQGTELSISQSLYDGNTVKLHCSQTMDVKSMVTKAYQWKGSHLTSLEVLSLFFPFYILATTHKRQVGGKTCKNTLSSPISKPLELDCSWTRHFITNNMTVWNEHIMLHFKYNSRGRVKLHALNSASIKLKANPRAVDEKHEGSKCAGTTLISSRWESRLTEPSTY